jgi:membrane fusion protein, copper/silver efflux system
MNKRELIISAVAVIIGATLMLLIGSFFWSSQEHDHHHPEAGLEEGQSSTWTCSMHPQIRRDEPGICPICEMDLIPMDKLSSDNPLEITMTETAKKIAQIQTVKVAAAEPGSGSEALTVSGYLTDDLDRTHTVTANYPGTVRNLRIKSTGEKISRGDLIAELYAPDLRADQLELIRAYEHRESKPELFQAMTRKMERWELSSATIDQILQKGSPLETLPIYAEKSGTVIRLDIEEGQYLGRGQQILRVSNQNHLWAEFQIMESDIKKVEVGSKVEFFSVSDPNTLFTSHIYYLDPRVDQRKRTAIVRARVQNTRGRLKPEMLIRGRVYTEHSIEPKNFRIPTSAVLWTGKRSVVYVQLPDREIPTFEYREVEIVERTSQTTIVSSGLELGDEIVVNGAFTIDSEAQLNNQRSMMNQLIEGEERASADRLQLRGDHKSSFDRALSQYIALKDHLVASDSDAAKKSANELLETLNAIPELIEDEEVFELWSSRQNNAVEGTKGIAETTDLEEQRAFFQELSNAVIFWIRHFDTPGELFYIQNCPMAFDDEGADWLSLEEGIKNPYYGDRMLRCGFTVEVVE